MMGARCRWCSSERLLLTASRFRMMIGPEFMLIAAALALPLRGWLGTVAAALLFAPAAWWAESVLVPTWQKLAFAVVGLVLALASRRAGFATSEPLGRHARAGETGIAAGLVIAGLVAGLFTSPLNARVVSQLAWHHWGAYLSAVEPLLSGGVPYRDFPVQYGLGPTLLLAGLCRGECFAGLYRATLVANALYLGGFGWAALRLTRGANRPGRWLAMAAMIVAVAVWTGFPIDWASPLMTPSVAGLRFLPLLAVIVVVIAVETGGLGDRLPPPSALVAGTAIWFIGLAWSPEAGAFTSVVWWPWVALYAADRATSGPARWLALFRWGAMGAAATLAGYAVLALLFRAIAGEWIALGDFLLYMRHLPGALPINPHGLVWFVLAVLLLAFATLAQEVAGPPARVLYAVLVGTLAALSYYMGRAHDNNILNLLPFLILLLLATVSIRPSALIEAFTRTALVAIIAYTAVIHWHSLDRPGGPPSAGPLQLGIEPILSRFAPAPGDPAPLVAPGAIAALTDLRKAGQHGVLFIDENFVMVRDTPGTAWTGMNNLANFNPLPPELRRRYVEAGARHWHRPGWIVAQTPLFDDWVDLYRGAYVVTPVRRYPGFITYRAVPR
jgi:hypothetical protein